MKSNYNEKYKGFHELKIERKRATFKTRNVRNKKGNAKTRTKSNVDIDSKVLDQTRLPANVQFLSTKKRKEKIVFSSFYGCFLSIKTPTIAIAIIMATAAPTM